MVELYAKSGRHLLGFSFEGKRNWVRIPRAQFAVL